MLTNLMQILPNWFWLSAGKKEVGRREKPRHAKGQAGMGAVTGWEISLYALLRGAERSVVMAWRFDNRKSFGTEDDRPFRRLHEPLPEGPLAGQAIDREELEEALTLYYELMDWDGQGRPAGAKLIDLGLTRAG